MTSIADANNDKPLREQERAAPARLLMSPAWMALALAVIAVGYYVGAWLAFAVRFPSSMYSVLWPPNAIVLAGLLLLPPRWWIPCLIAVFPAHVAIELSAGLPWMAILGLFITNTSQGLLAAALINQLSRQHVSSSSHMVIFIACGVFAAPLLVSFADVTVSELTGLSSDFWDAWRLRFLSNAASTIIFVPPILAVVRTLAAARPLPPKKLAEALLLAGSFMVFGAAVATAKSALSSLLPLMLCMFLPLLLWAAMRFGQGGASWALLGLVSVTIASLTHWPLATGGQEGVLLLQAFFLLVSIPVLYLAALHQDLNRYVQALDTTTQRYQLATAAGSVGVWEWNPGTGELFIDSELKKILGFEDRDIANYLDAWMKHVDPGDVERVLQLANACLRGEKATFEDEHRMLHANGSTRWFLSRGALLRNEAGEPVRLIGSDIDITERKRIADDLHSLEVLSSGVLASLNQQVAIIDCSGIIIAVNDAWMRFARENAIARYDSVSKGANYLDVCRHAAADADAMTALRGITAVLDGTHAEFRMEYACPSPDAMRWFEMSVIPLRRPEGGAVVSHRDITSRKLMEIESEQQRQELAHLTRVGILSELSGALAHELNQPLTAILSNAQAAKLLLAREDLDLEEVRGALDDIVLADRRAGDVIHRLRTLLRKGAPQFQPIDLNEIVGEVLEFAHSDLVVRDVNATCGLLPDLPLIQGDHVQLQQVLLNLIMNACEAMSQIEPRERILTITTALSQNNTARICVIDSGSGIPEDIERRLFEPFVTTKAHGLGLGLSISRTIIAAHGGDLSAVNNPGRGAIFCIALPILPEGGAGPGNQRT
jgi:PAS domain S-box-containing protein